MVTFSWYRSTASIYAGPVRIRKWYNCGYSYNASVRYQRRHIMFSRVIRFCVASHRVALWKSWSNSTFVKWVLRRFATSCGAVATLQIRCRPSHRAVASQNKVSIGLYPYSLQWQRAVNAVVKQVLCDVISCQPGTPRSPNWSLRALKLAFRKPSRFWM